MNLPITSRIKRSPLLKKSDPKDDKDKKGPDKDDGVFIGGSSGTADTVIKGKKAIPKKTLKEAYASRGSEYKDLSFSDYAVKAQEDDAYGTSGSDATPDTVIKGNKSSYDGKAKIETRGDVFNPWETRSQSRSIKKEQRDIRRAKIKAARKNGTLTSDKRKQYKAEEAEAELKAFQAMSTRNSKSRASGRVGGTDVRTGERDMTMSEISSNQASIQAQKKNKAAKAERDKITTANSNSAREAVNTDSEGKNKDKKTIASNSQAANAPMGTTTQAPQYNYGSTRKNPAPAKKKNSPYKMKGSTYNK